MEERPQEEEQTKEEEKQIEDAEKPKEEEKKEQAPKKVLDREQVYQVMKALTAMKLVKEDATPGAVLPDLFLGSVGAAYNLGRLQELGITHILTCAAGIKARFPEVMIYEQLPCLDSPNQNMLQYIDRANKFINEALKDNIEGEPPKHKVLVHCFAGKSRATTFTLGYLIKERKITLKEGLEMCWKVRPIAAPNPGFMIQLKSLEKNVLGSLSDCEVMQGQWKEKLDALVKHKEEKGETVKVPSDDVIIKNAEKIILKANGIDPSPLDEQQASDIKQV